MIDPAQTHTRPIIACGARSTTTHRVTGGIVDNPEQRGSGPAHRAVPVRTASACPYAQSLTRGQVSGAAVLCSVLSRPQSLPVGYIMLLIHAWPVAQSFRRFPELRICTNSPPEIRLRSGGAGTEPDIPRRFGDGNPNNVPILSTFFKMYPKWPLLAR